MSPYDWLPSPDDDESEKDDRIDLTDTDEDIDSLRVEGSQPTRHCLSPRITADGLVYILEPLSLRGDVRMQKQPTNKLMAK
jgi:hypothetical protein